MKYHGVFYIWYCMLISFLCLPQKRNVSSYSQNVGSVRYDVYTQKIPIDVENAKVKKDNIIFFTINQNFKKFFLSVGEVYSLTA